MSYRDDRAYLFDMLEHARFLLEETQGWGLDDLTANRLLASGIVREIQIIGEAASKVSVETRHSVSSIPWHMIIGMRHRLVHAYEAVDWSEILSVLENDLHSLVEILEAYFGD
jgi:uncharacterized protein with HEPN domain